MGYGANYALFSGVGVSLVIDCIRHCPGGLACAVAGVAGSWRSQ